MDAFLRSLIIVSLSPALNAAAQTGSRTEPVRGEAVRHAIPVEPRTTEFLPESSLAPRIRRPPLAKNERPYPSDGIHEQRRLNSAQAFSGNIGILVFLRLKFVRKKIKESIARTLFQTMETRPLLKLEGTGRNLKWSRDTLELLQTLSLIAMDMLNEKIDGRR